MRTLVLLNLTLLALAQTPTEPEIRGTVTEFGLSEPIAGAQVVVSEFVVIDSTLTRKPITTVYADNRGSFTYKPGHIGRFWIEAHRDGYTTPQAGSTFVIGMGVAETSVDLTQARPVSNTNLMLFRPGTLTGRVVDDEGKPVANLVVTLIQPGITTPPVTAKTDNDGNFTFTGLPVSSRVIQIGPASAQTIDVMETFTEKDLTAIDRDFELSYWPGGVSEPDQALPVQITPSAVVNLGTLRARKVTYYRAHLKFEGECEANENWILGFPMSARTAILPAGRPAKCRKDLLIRTIPPGSRTLVISSRGEPSWKFALIPLNIRNENVHAAFNFTPSEDIPVRLIDRDDGKIPALKGAMLVLNSAAGLAQSLNLSEDSVVRDVIPSRQQIHFFTPITANIAIQEIRYNRQPVPDGVFDIVHGAELEIMLDQRPAAISFTGASAGATMLLAKWPLAGSLAKLEARPPYTHLTIVDRDGKGQFTGLPSGEYRVIAVPAAEISRVRDPQTLFELLTKGEKITLERGEQKSIEIKR